LKQKFCGENISPFIYTVIFIPKWMKILFQCPKFQKIRNSIFCISFIYIKSWVSYNNLRIVENVYDYLLLFLKFFLKIVRVGVWFSFILKGSNIFHFELLCNFSPKIKHFRILNQDWVDCSFWYWNQRKSKKILRFQKYFFLRKNPNILLKWIFTFIF
jgi:hypothetical protein